MTGGQWQHLVAMVWPVAAALILGYVVHHALRGLGRRSHGKAPWCRRARVLEVVALPAALAVPLLFLDFALGMTPLPPSWTARAQHVLGIGIIVCLTWLVVRAVGAVERGILRRFPVDTVDNLRARRIQTQARVLSRIGQGAVLLVGFSLVLMSFPEIRRFGTTLLASAGIAGVVAGIAAKPVFGNLIAGLQIALSQPIRLDDVVIVQGEWGRIEEISSTYVVVRIWDDRRLVVPLQWFIENPFQNWTRTSSELLGDVLLRLDYRTPMDAVRAEFERICDTDPRWDRRVRVAQVTDADATTMAVRLLVSARHSSDLFDLRCAVRERMIDFLLAAHPEALPRLRASVVRGTTRPDAEDVRSQAAQRVSQAVATDTASPGPETPAGESADANRTTPPLH